MVEIELQAQIRMTAAVVDYFAGFRVYDLGLGRVA
jgi:hypothetical protein